MATYNGESYIRRQLVSILSQLGHEDEIVISDDRSDDTTLGIIREFNDNRILLFTNNKPRSPIVNLENALVHSSGDLIFLSDQDDIWKLDKVRKMSDLMQEYDMVVCDCEIIDKNDEVITPSFYNAHKSGPGVLKNFYRNSFLGCCMAFKRRILDKALPFPPKIPMHDIWLGMIGSLYGRTYFTPDILVSYRRHGDNTSSASERSKYGLYKKALFRYHIASNIITRFAKS
jgi:glycosyltransferase involved in cell wall biosynthesis